MVARWCTASGPPAWMGQSSSSPLGMYRSVRSVPVSLPMFRTVSNCQETMSQDELNDLIAARPTEDAEP